MRAIPAADRAIGAVASLASRRSVGHGRAVATAPHHPEEAVLTAALTVAIVGAHGGMGRLFGRVFRDAGHAVLEVDVTTELRAEDAASRADVVLVTVPIEATEAAIAAVGPHVRDCAVLCDLTSLKSEPVRTMLESTGASVVGMHPMFGPGVHGFDGQRIVLCPGRGDAWLDRLRAILERAGFSVTVADATEHDRAMALVQVLTHFQTQVLGLTLARFGVALEEPLRFTSPAYLLELYVTARHFAQSPALYGPIEMRNPETDRVTEVFLASAREVADVLARRDQAAFDAMFAEVGRFFGPFTREALDNSDFLIDRLVELTKVRVGSEGDGVR